MNSFTAALNNVCSQPLPASSPPPPRAICSPGDQTGWAQQETGRGVLYTISGFIQLKEKQKISADFVSFFESSIQKHNDETKLGP